ncbi:hypothetical protein BOX15_Mlig027823g2 [Macrostomum lignano]|uniref:Uncharacterized protein n=1 Tax=Macrostomum lignano TaxID=282301 RepID=A0A267DRA1_9PLAT|nr:hypothetical protein BOX15_Mlig027823g2 [Macrostomum lignano]
MDSKPSGQQQQRQPTSLASGSGGLFNWLFGLNPDSYPRSVNYYSSYASETPALG